MRPKLLQLMKRSLPGGGAVLAKLRPSGRPLWLGTVKLGGFTLHPLVLLFAISGSLMISRIRIPKL